MRPSPASIKANPPMDCGDGEDFHSETDRFLRWFLGFPGTTFSDSIRIVDLRSKHAGRGIGSDMTRDIYETTPHFEVAIRDIPEETVLFTVPRSMILNPETYAQQAKQSSILQAFQDENENENENEHGGGGGGGGTDTQNRSSSSSSSWPLMILILMSEFFESESSRFLPYIEILPSSFETPMFWTEQELAELQASATRSKIGRDVSDKMFLDLIVPFIRRHGEAFEGSGGWSDEELVGLAHRMGSTLMAYAFDFDRDGGGGGEEKKREENEEWEEEEEHASESTTMGMVPMADILNADAEFNAHVVHEPDCLTVRSLRTIKAGEEVLNYYGPHPNSELLRRYGYVTPKHARYDVVEIPWSTIEAAVSSVLSLSPEQASKAHDYMVAKVEEEGGEIEDVFVLERQYDDPNPDGTFPGPAAFTGAPEELDDQLKMFLKAAKKTIAGASSAVSEKRKRERIQAAVMLRALADVEARYPTSLAEDEQILSRGKEGEEGGEGHDISSRLRMAVAVRLGEKRLMREAREYYAAVDREADGDVDMDGDAGSHKRARRS